MNLSFKKRESVVGWIFSVPTFAWILLIIIFPVYSVFMTSLHHQRAVQPNPPYVGVANYIEIILSTEFWSSLQRTLVWTGFNLALIVPVGILIALLLNSDFKTTRVLRNWILLPWMIPIVVTTLMFRWMLEPTVGILNFTLIKSGIINIPLAFLGDKSLAMPTVIGVNVWRWTPFMTVVILAALQTVPGELYDAASVDGANLWQKFWFVTFPQILPSVLTTSLILTMWLLNMFPPIWLLTEGGPSDATTTLPIIIYRTGFKIFKMGRSATYSVTLLAIEVTVASIYLGLLGKRQRGE